MDLCSKLFDFDLTVVAIPDGYIEIVRDLLDSIGNSVDDKRTLITINRNVLKTVREMIGIVIEPL